MRDWSKRELLLAVESRILPLFFHFLQDGFFLEAWVGCTIREFLLDRCRLSHQTITKRISTVFLDGMPVDDLDRAIVKHNSTLALSGAMPGLVGAVMRSNSPLRSFRDSITHRGGEESAQHTLGLVRLKLFNTVMRKLAPRFLKEGILLEPSVVKSFLASQPVDGRGKIRGMQFENQPADMKTLFEATSLSGPDLVALSVTTHE